MRLREAVTAEGGRVPGRAAKSSSESCYRKTKWLRGVLFWVPSLKGLGSPCIRFPRTCVRADEWRHFATGAPIDLHHSRGIFLAKSAFLACSAVLFPAKPLRKNHLGGIKFRSSL